MKRSLDVIQASVRVRRGAPLHALARREANARTKAAKEKLRAEQPARLDAYVAAVAAWCNTPSRRRNRTPSPRAADFGILNELKAIAYLFKNLTIEY